ncbi:MAG: hypothetical protein DRI48_01875 [Chloroflexi bacterium]|nr:MAG: hypothetical protein DRI48_01875 [Chloroflexota bacterium]
MDRREREDREKEPAPDPELTTVYVAYGLSRAHVIRAKLEEEGIPSLLEYESIGPIMGIIVDGLGEVLVKVPAEYADQARALIE